MACIVERLVVYPCPSDVIGAEVEVNGVKYKVTACKIIVDCNILVDVDSEACCNCFKSVVLAGEVDQSSPPDSTVLPSNAIIDALSNGSVEDSKLVASISVDANAGKLLAIPAAADAAEKLNSGYNLVTQICSNAGYQCSYIVPVLVDVYADDPINDVRVEAEVEKLSSEETSSGESTTTTQEQPSQFSVVVEARIHYNGATLSIDGCTCVVQPRVLTARYAATVYAYAESIPSTITVDADEAARPAAVSSIASAMRCGASGTATISIEIDAEKLAEIVKESLESQGVKVEKVVIEKLVSTDFTVYWSCSPPAQQPTQQEQQRTVESMTQLMLSAMASGVSFAAIAIELGKR